MKALLYCPRCGSDQVVPFGLPSKLDGKKDHLCQYCKLDLGPSRSRILTWGLIFVGSIAGLMGLWILWGVDIAGGFAILGVAIPIIIIGIIDLRKRKPLRKPPSEVSWQKPVAPSTATVQKPLRLWRVVGTHEATGSEVTREVRADSLEEASAECLLDGIEVTQVTEITTSTER